MASPRITEAPPDLGKQLAATVEAIKDLHNEKALFNSEWKDRMERLQQQMHKLSHDVMYGQSQLPIDMGAVVEKAVERVNSGALDQDGVTIRAKVTGKSAAAGEGSETHA